MPAAHILIPVAALTLGGAATAVLYRLRRLRRALDAERAARRLTDRLQQRDMETFADRLEAAVQAQRALAEAQQILDTALTAHHPEGGHPS